MTPKPSSARRKPDKKNDMLIAARLRLMSPSGSGETMSTQELAEAMNAYLWAEHLKVRGSPEPTVLDHRFVAAYESGRFWWPSKHYRAAFRAVLKVATDAELGFSPKRKRRTRAQTSPSSTSTERAVDVVGARMGMPDRPAVSVPSQISVTPVSAQPPNRKDTLVEPPPLILARIREQDDAVVSDAMLDVLELYVADVVDRYEEEGPVALAPDVVRQRQWVEPFLHCWTKPGHHERLMRVAGRLSGQLSYMAINLGRFSSARAYGVEAFELANHIEDDDLRAWTRGTQSLAEFYTGHYKRALEFAGDGRRYAGSGRQAVRLAINGQARALGQLGERGAVDKAVDKAYELLGTFPPEPGMTPCISYGVYSEARVASNAATAYLPLAKGTAKALEHAERASVIVDASPSLWSRTLVRLDKATALIKAEQPDAEFAAALAREAMTISSSNRIESIKQRTRSLVTELAPWSTEPVVATVVDEAAAWLSEDPPADDIL